MASGNMARTEPDMLFITSLRLLNEMARLFACAGYFRAVYCFNTGS
jgi:hypothetical protein